MIRIFRDIELGGDWKVSPKVTKVTYQKAFIVGPYLQEKIGVEIEVNDETPAVALQLAKEIVEKFHKDNNPQLTDAKTITWDIPVEDRSVQGPRVDAIIEDINSCTELKVLESYRLMAKMSPKLQEAYDNKLKQLQ